MPEPRQNNSKLAEMLARASNFRALVGMAVDVVDLFMALLSFVESAPRAYRLKASNAAPPFSTSAGTSAVILIALAGLPAGPLQAGDKPTVVATFSVLGDMVANVAGDHVDLVTIVGPDGDTELYQPTLADSRVVAKARVV